MKHEPLPLVSTPQSEFEPRALCGGVMFRLDLSYFHRLSGQLARIRWHKPDANVGEMRAAMAEARSWIVDLSQEQVFGSIALRTAKAHIPNVLANIDQILALEDDASMNFDMSIALWTAMNSFEGALTTELSMADAYYVREKKPYSTLSLVTEGEALFPPNTLSKVPEARDDLREVGKCLAFELPTAAAFHIHRATEAVLRRYWTAVTGGAPKPKLRTIGVYLAAMKKLNCGDSKVIAALSQMNELHRNPTIHPEDMLNLDEAIALLGIANSVVAAMLKEIPDAQPGQASLPGLGPGLAELIGKPTPTDDAT